MEYIVYQITNLLNGKYYVGAHQTSEIDDGYMSSSKVVKNAIKKHGKENFKKEVLYNFLTLEEMFKKEAEIVDEKFVNRKNTYNLKTGGTGSTSHMNTRDEAHSKRCSDAARNQKNRYDISQHGVKYQFGLDAERTARATELSRSPEAIAKRKKTFSKIKHQQGEKNSQFGSRWIYSLSEEKSKKILKSDPIPEGWLLGRKTKF
jgi:hypothetical protein